MAPHASISPISSSTYIVISTCRPVYVYSPQKKDTGIWQRIAAADVLYMLSRLGRFSRAVVLGADRRPFVGWHASPARSMRQPQANHLPFPMENNLAVFDFDNTVVDANSDTFILDALDPALRRKCDQLSRSMQWTDLMDLMACELHAKGHTRADMEKALAAIPMVCSLACCCVGFVATAVFPSSILGSDTTCQCVGGGIEAL